MKLLDEHETKLAGKWIEQEGSVIQDDVCKRIDFLTTHHLREVCMDAPNWTALYLDPTDGRYWELTYPYSEMHGGGPPVLEWIPEDHVAGKYGIKRHNEQQR